ncbi:Membrane-bound protein LytR [Clostridium bornimense]|uniref:Membrane-bound protein LytR n=1 Tax=Clostridium bornimense TaxID=1216932 RepID=W6RZU9_9CLOT|nr:LCP family protein [Clostridium bornimense]CDM70186.1 Membrane-bound protein LytR [Clostridium bornimense]
MNKKNNNKVKKFKRVFKRVFLLLLILILIGCIWIYITLSSLNNGNETTATDNVALRDPVNILLYGMDNVPGSPASRTDTIMIMHYDPETKDTTLVSLPRDTMISQDTYEPKVIGRTAKLTEVHYDSQLAYDIDTARDNLINAVKNFFGINSINYYVSIDYNGFSEIIDAIGGVDIVPIYNMKYHDPVDNLEIDFEKGKEYHLNGEDALKFVRWRKNDDGVESETDGSDLGRIENQRYFISALINELSSPLGIIKTPSLISKGCRYIKTDLPANKILAYTLSILKSGNDNLTSETLKGSTKNVNGTDYFVYNASENRDIINMLNSGNNEDIEDRSDLYVTIRNSSGKDGLAGKLREKLVNQYGYTYDNITTETGASLVNKSSIIVSSNSSISNLDSLCDEIDIDNIYTEDNYNNDITIIIGRDFSD